MNSADAHQLRLVRDAVERLDIVPGEREPLRVLLAELIAKEALDLPRITIAQEASYQQALEELVSLERKGRERAADGDEGIDLPALGRFFRKTFPAEDSLEVVNADTVSRGMSKKTVLITLEGSRRLPRELVLRADRTANNYLGTTVVDEWGPVQLLWQHGARVPRPLALEPSGSVIGDPFLVFERASGSAGGGIYAPPGDNPALLIDMAACLASIHRVPTENWPVKGQPQGVAYFDAQFASHLADWEGTGEANAIMNASFDWIYRNRHLADGPLSVTHDDFNVNNVLIESNRVTAVLDWEFAHIGTPAADLGYLWYTAESLDSFGALLIAYESAGGTPPPAEQLQFYRLWGQLRLAVMGFKSVNALETGKFDDARFGIARWHRRRGLLRLAGLLEELGVS